ncbi:MAG: hypothetical protein IJW59_01915 [Clostridia bacterium]|nr:hypothetical protein [Clostridia bacterium]
MIVKEIIKRSAELLGLKEVVDAIDSNEDYSVGVKEDIDNLLIAVNMVNNNIAGSYIELIGLVNVESFSGFIPYVKISNNSIIEIKKILKDGIEQEFRLFPEGVKVDTLGMCEVEYSYFPERVEFDSEINHYLKINELVFALGVVGEYLYIKGAIDDAYMWDKRFKSSMFNLVRPKRNLVIPARRWE